MIFVSVGAQMPFDRLVRAVDAWAARSCCRDVFAQIGRGAVPPRHIAWTAFLSPSEFAARVRSASLIVAHAGMGSILTALEFGKPILVMPRRGDLGETRNDHQVATARRFSELGRVAVALDADELATQLDRFVADPSAAVPTIPPISPCASPELIAALRTFIAAPGART